MNEQQVHLIEGTTYDRRENLYSYAHQESESGDLLIFASKDDARSYMDEHGLRTHMSARAHAQAVAKEACDRAERNHRRSMARYEEALRLYDEARAAGTPAKVLNRPRKPGKPDVSYEAVVEENLPSTTYQIVSTTIIGATMEQKGAEVDPDDDSGPSLTASQLLLRDFLNAQGVRDTKRGFSSAAFRLFLEEGGKLTKSAHTRILSDEQRTGRLRSHSTGFGKPSVYRLTEFGLRNLGMEKS